MNRRRARARRRATQILDQESRLRIEEIKEERRQALAQLQSELEPAREAHEAVYRKRRSELQAEFSARADAVRRAAASGIAVTSKAPS